MILEAVFLHIKAGQTAEFEKNFRSASRLMAKTEGYLSHNLQKCLEDSHKYLLLIYWETLASHTVNFRQSPEYLEWKALLHHFYQPFPTVEHFQEVELEKTLGGSR